VSAALIKPSLRGMPPYAAPVRAAAGELLLDLNEGVPLSSDGWLADIARSVSADRLRRYPDASALEARIGARFGIDAGRVIVTNGGDDAIDRVCRACLGAGDSMVLPSPSFEMIARSGVLAGGVVRRVPWLGGRFPVERVIDSCEQRTRIVAVVSPNNPTGGTIAAEDLGRLSAALPGVLIMVDLAYVEFASADLTEFAMALPNTVLVRTFSKAYGLAGMRVGYAIGHGEVVTALRAVGGPFPCSVLSIAAAGAALDIPAEQLAARLERVRNERVMLAALLQELGASVLESEANFVLAKFPSADRVWSDLGKQGVRVKRFSDPVLEGYLRIGCPGDPAGFERLTRSLRRAAEEEVVS
jgi:histidinol-phosphate aminotransferase